MNQAHYVLLNDGWDEKTTICYPDVVGPFASEQEALDFVRKHPRATVFPDDHPHWPKAIVLEPIDGGYAGAHIIGPDAPLTDPESYLEQWG